MLLNLYPYSNGHLMVAPYRHVAPPASWTRRSGPSCGSCSTRDRRADGAMAPHGFNAGLNLGRVAGAGVEGHLHLHVVPRWNGDTNFMPVLADVRVMPEHLSRTLEQLRAAWPSSLSGVLVDVLHWVVTSSHLIAGRLAAFPAAQASRAVGAASARSIGPVARCPRGANTFSDR